ncbi:Fe2+-dependent dioxygenase [Psychrosphaera haliotis]|uniref:Fe2+-dependent dioxygenase n=1 Tax=Psychrosphaera haliotis TaxID=555083 RepID=A0A6N8F571_9GAMM|nr:Fe2+-dependent dioxygenase [Psychrosphaera haliotis]MUH71433.1 Fe2+-dependent dioxygenase [Psychrosphaera haliotis]
MVVIDQLLTSDEVKVVREALLKTEWENGDKTAMGMASSVKKNNQANPNDPIIKDLANELLGRIGSAPKVVSAALPQKIFPPCFNRYSESEEYGYHVDAAIMRLPNSNEVLRSDVSMTLFLSEPDEYEGGELIIQTEFGEQQVKLPAGYVVVYPSSSLHKVTAVTKGRRIAVITWMQSMVGDVTTRQSLFKLDQTIQDLIKEGNTSREHLDQLHNVYHNLIRQFSQV